MYTSKRQLRERSFKERSFQEDLKDWYEYRLLQGLNGRLHPKIGEPKPEALLPRDSAAIKRIELLLVALQGATSTSDSEPMGLSDKALGFQSREKFLEWANSDLKRYMQFPVIFVDPSSNEFASKMEHCSGDEWENDAVNSILWLLNNGQLHRLKRCFCCGTWFYAVRDRQRFCRTACRQKEHSQSPEFKKERARYMREEYRPLERKREERAKRQASRVLGKRRK